MKLREERVCNRKVWNDMQGLGRLPRIITDSTLLKVNRILKYNVWRGLEVVWQNLLLLRLTSEITRGMMNGCVFIKPESVQCHTFLQVPWKFKPAVTFAFAKFRRTYVNLPDRLPHKVSLDVMTRLKTQFSCLIGKWKEINVSGQERNTSYFESKFSLL